MYGVLIVDDEKYIRKSIINRIHWEKCGTTIIGEASDGDDALKSISLSPPDIIITDIRMPGLDGLELAQKIAKDYPLTKIIIISAYNDFEYAQKALRYGVKEYILKPVNEEELESTLKKLCSELDKEGKPCQIPQICLDSVNEKVFHHDCFLITSFYLLQIHDITHREEKIAQIYRILKCGTVSFAEPLEIFLLREDSESHCSFLWNASCLTEYTVQRILRTAEEKIFVGLSQAYRLEHPAEQEIIILLTESITALKGKIFGGYTIKCFHENLCQKNVLQKYKNTFLRLYDLSVQEDMENIRRLTRDIITEQLPCASSVLELEFLVNELIFILERISRSQKYLYETRILFCSLKKTDFLLQFTCVKDLAEKMLQLSDTALSYKNHDRQYDVLEEIRNHVQQHFAENLSVADLAKKYHLNATYLSTIFKERNKISLSAYIEGVRMENAKKFLKADQESITKTAMDVGYSDPNYFTKVFRKYTGMTPTQWKKEQNKKERT